MSLDSSRAANNPTTATTVFWDVTPYNLVEMYLRFDRTSYKNGGNGCNNIITHSFGKTITILIISLQMSSRLQNGLFQSGSQTGNVNEFLVSPIVLHAPPMSSFLISRYVTFSSPQSLSSTYCF